MSTAARGGIYLKRYLAPIADALARPDVTDIYINRPGELWLEASGGQIEKIDAPDLDEATLSRLASQVAALSHQGINREHPLLSAKLPDGSRIQVVAPPATRGAMALAIRKQIAPTLTLADYEKAGLFAEVGMHRDGKQALALLVSEKRYAQALSLAVRERKNILVAGGTSTGKTTFLNALLREVPPKERLILIEDTPEITVQHDNHVGLVAVRGELGEAKVTANDLVAASLRMRPDRIILGELRGDEAFAFLRAVNSGHPGSMTTIHADSPDGAVEQLVLLVLQSGTRLDRSDIRHYIKSTIDVFVQLGRKNGKRIVEEIVFGHA